MESTSISDPQRSFVVLRCVSDFYIFLVATSRVTAVPSGFGPHPPKSKRSKKTSRKTQKHILKKSTNKNHLPQKLLKSPATCGHRQQESDRATTEQRVAWLWLSACPIARPPGLGPGSDALHPLPQCPFKATRRGDMSNFWDLGFFFVSKAFF